MNYGPDTNKIYFVLEKLDEIRLTSIGNLLNKMNKKILENTIVINQELIQTSLLTKDNDERYNEDKEVI